MNLELNEEYGAGFEGTKELLYKYLKDTPGQKIVKYMDKTNTELEESITAENYLKQYAQGIEHPKVPVKGTYMKEELEEINLQTVRTMKIVSLATGCTDSAALYEYALTAPTYTSLVELKENFNRYIQKHMKKLSEILNEAPEGITESIVVPSYILSILKTLGFTPAEPGPKTYRILSGPNKIEALYGIPMRAGYWADVFFAILDNEKAPYCVVDSDGRDCYKDGDDAIKALQKRMRTIKEETYTNYNDFKMQHKKMYPSHTEEQTKAAWEKYKKMTYTAQVRQANKDDRTNRAAAWGKVFSNLRKEEVDGDEEVDATGEALLELEDICEMADELYETLSDLDEIDSETRENIAKIYSSLDDLYETVDKKYEVTVDLDEYEEVNEEVDMNRFKQLASTGLVSREELPKLVLAMRALDADKPLSMSQKDLINSTFQSLIAIVTGDTSVLSKVKSSISNN